jgi:hypothetical protein
MMHPMMGGGYQYFFQESHFIDVPSMIPELCEQMQRSHSCDHDLRNTKQCRGKQQNREQVEKCGDTLTEGTSQIKFLAAVMDYMQIPKEIDLVTPTVDPISVEIE